MFISFKEIATISVLMYIILQELISNYKLLKKLLTVKLKIKHKMLTAYYLQIDR